MKSALQVKLRYVLGEWQFCKVELKLAPVSRPIQAAGVWPSLEEVDFDPPAGCDGFLCERANIADWALGIRRFGKWLAYVPRHERLYFIRLQGTYEQYLHRRSPKSRYNLRRSIRLLEERNRGQIFQSFEAPEEMAVFHAAAVAISKKTYQGRMLGAGMPASVDYLRKMTELAAQGRAHGYLLCDAGQMVAFAWCTSSDRLITYQIIGYLPERASVSPGTVLLALIIEHLYEERRFDAFDFGVGESNYKSAFATDQLNYVDVHLLRPSLRNAFSAYVHWWLNCASAAIGVWLNRMGYKRKIRMLMRRLRGVSAT